MESLIARPFHIYDEEFLDIIGPNPTLTLLNHTESDPIFHEAPVWYVTIPAAIDLRVAKKPAD
jgi:gluconolactonase